MSIICPICQHEVAETESVCPTCGFKLQGTTQKIEPIPVEKPAEETEAPKPREIPVLKVVRGPQTGVVYRIADAPVSIGRSPKCDIFLNDMTVSRTHAVIEREGDAYVIRDDNSFNGIWINNKNIEAKPLVYGDVIQIGAFCLAFDRG